MPLNKNNHIPQVSICIPYYNQPLLLKRNLESIASQDFNDFEVIITDDSPVELSQKILDDFSKRFTLHYHKNSKSMGSPRNWNHAIEFAKGTYVMIFHQDDFFSKKSSLSTFVERIQTSKSDFVFGNISPDEKRNIIKKIPKWISALEKNPQIILKNNIIGPPSNVIFRNSRDLQFDENLIWAVDYDLYYKWMISGKKFIHINDDVVCIGTHDQQITRFCDENPLIKLNENVYLYNKYKNTIKLNISMYDFYWRCIRNNQIKNTNMTFSTPKTDIPMFMSNQIQIQNLLGYQILKIGIFSKIIMLLSFYISKFKKRK